MDAPQEPDLGRVDERRQAVGEWLERLDPRAETWESELSAVTMQLLDAVVHGDTATLQSVTDPLRDELADLFEDEGHAREIRGYLLALLSMTRGALDRLPDPTDVAITHDSYAWQVLEALDDGRVLTSTDLQQKLGTSPSQVSRVGRNLLAHGLVAQRRAGRTAVWELTPRGRGLVRRDDDDRHAGAR